MDDEEGVSSANKRPCISPPAKPHLPPASSPSPLTVLNPPPATRPSEQANVESLLHNLLELSTSSSSLSLDVSLVRLLNSKPSDSYQNLLIDRALSLGSAIVEAAKRCARKKASKHNSNIWSLPPDLTIKVFSKLDTTSLSYAAATCTMFHLCAMDPMCYADIDLRTVVPKVNNAVVSTMIQRAGQMLQSLKLGVVSGPNTSSQHLDYTYWDPICTSGCKWHEKRSKQGKNSTILTRSCLNSLSIDGAAAGLLLKRLHLCNIDRMDSTTLRKALSACPSLLDLEVVGLHIELRLILESVGMNCHALERLVVESSKTGRDDSLKVQACVDLVNNCPCITSLALRGFKLHDCEAHMLVKGFHRLKHVDFSMSYSISGSFLRNLGNSAVGCVMEFLLLKDCTHLKQVEVVRFITSLLEGDFKLLHHIDVSNKEGLAADGTWCERCYNSSIIPYQRLSEVRPNLSVLAEFPPEGSFLEMDYLLDSDVYSDISASSRLSSHPSDSSFISVSESSDHSDHGSGNDEDRDANYPIYVESSDDMDFMGF